MPTLAERHMRGVIEEKGWASGSSLENLICLYLSRHRFTPAEVAQQFRVGAYRLDFAWPVLKVAIEADGWMHRSPEHASKDRRRDSWLRNEGWLIFRVDDEYGEESIASQLTRVALVIRRLER